MAADLVLRKGPCLGGPAAGTVMFIRCVDGATPEVVAPDGRYLWTGTAWEWLAAEVEL